MKKKITTVIVAALLTNATAQESQGPVGFVNYSDLGQQGITGGAAGEIVHVTTRSDFDRYVRGNTPYIIILDADLSGKGLQDMNDEVSLGSNKSIIGAGAGHALNGICLDASGQSNIIIRNITLTKGRTDGLSFRNCHHVWIDHCDLSDCYDGLLDFTVGSDYMTCSWTKLHNHNKVSITNSGTCHYEDYNREHVTFAHCWFANNTQRNPRIGYGRMHIYNCYWTDISSYCIGFHSQAQVLSEYNYFSKTANNPFCNQYSDVLPYRGYLTDNGSYFANGNPGKTYAHKFTDISYNPSTYYDFSFDQVTTVADVASSTMKGCGPIEGLVYEPILNPGNGAIQVPLSQMLTWSPVDGATSTRMLIGTDREQLTETAPDAVELQPATTYYWQVIATVGGVDHPSPVYQFTTAAPYPTNPYPEVGAKTAWLRWPSQRDQFCTPLPLQWRPAADAKSYQVYVGKAADAMNYVGETAGLQLVPDYRFLPTGETYYWRVDAVKHDGTVITGQTWDFTPIKKQWKEGANEVYSMYVSGIAFRESVESFTGGKGVRGDQGPGAIHAVWSGAAGRYAIETITYDQTLGPNLIGVSVNDQLIDAWLTNDAAYAFSTRKTRHTVELNPGDEVRIDFVAGYVNGGLNESVAHIDQVNFIATTAETIENARPAGKHHEPEMTRGYQYEYLPVSNVLFRDTLGTVGERGTMQVKDMYCSWISKTESQYTLYLQQTAMAVMSYSNHGSITSDTIRLDKASKVVLEVPMTSDKGYGTLQTICLYKTLPTTTIYYEPTADASKDYQLLWSPDCIYLDSNGQKGDKGKVQVRDSYDQWMKYTNPSANEVHAKNSQSGIKCFIDPMTDRTVAAFVPKGSDGSTYCYVAGTQKSMTYYLQHCQRLKLYYSGTAGTATNLFIEITEAGNASSTTRVYGDNAEGKNVASETVETPLDPSKAYQVKAMATTGDMLIYALKLWPGAADGIEQVGADDDESRPVLYDLMGRRVAVPTARGIYLKKR